MKKLLIILFIISLISSKHLANPIPDQNKKNNSKSVNESNVEYLTFFLVSPNVDDMIGDISKYLIAVNSKIESKLKPTIEEKIASSLNSLFNIKSFKYNQSGLHNLLYLSNLNVKEVTDSDGIYTIELIGEIIGISSVADAFIKNQIIKTIEQYCKNYIIKLNNSEKEWRCSLDKSGNCE